MNALNPLDNVVAVVLFAGKAEKTFDKLSIGRVVEPIYIFRL